MRRVVQLIAKSVVTRLLTLLGGRADPDRTVQSQLFPARYMWSLWCLIRGERLTEGGDSRTLLVSQPCWDWDMLITQLTLKHFYPVINPNKFIGLPSWTEHSGLLVSSLSGTNGCLFTLGSHVTVLVRAIF